MGMYDRDWYREERRQARQASQQMPAQPVQRKTAQKGPPGLLNGLSAAIILVVFAAVLIALGFA